MIIEWNHSGNAILKGLKRMIEVDLTSKTDEELSEYISKINRMINGYYDTPYASTIGQLEYMRQIAQDEMGERLRKKYGDTENKAEVLNITVE